MNARLIAALVAVALAFIAGWIFSGIWAGRSGGEEEHRRGAIAADALRAELGAEGDRLRREIEIINGERKVFNERERNLDRRESELRDRQSRFERERALDKRERDRLAKDGGTVGDIDRLLREAERQLKTP